ncbi:hypothetical protein EDB81DRAFT_767195 [Dactylonectria macrodidyma]|uniref:Uncharacterized protein n=1 Tax=Dactylonectria macrodidyma TaxID=307937 RepID=A0A9P9DEC2_9HYPO|nr:hypothetical protein EDB81DRAFT_767195 [Dactylonectria macrodidyma]
MDPNSPWANLTSNLTCGTFCSFVPEPTVRGTAGILWSILIPMLSAAFGTVYMRASLVWWRRVLDFLLRVFFPEISLFKITKEEILRSSILRDLHGAGLECVTNQQLMSIQQGKLFVPRSLPSFNMSADKVGYLSPNIHIEWLSENPTDSESRGVDIGDVDAYKHLLTHLPTGHGTWRGIGYPDLGTMLLTMQLIWLMAMIVLRITSGFLVSMLELYCLFSLTAFIAERCITKMNIPAWSQPVLVSGPQIMFEPGAVAAAPYIPTTWKQVLLVLPCLQFIGWPIFMMVYGIKAFPDDVGVRFTPTVCMAAGGRLGGAWDFLDAAEPLDDPSH